MPRGLVWMSRQSFGFKPELASRLTAWTIQDRYSGWSSLKRLQRALYYEAMLNLFKLGKSTGWRHESESAAARRRPEGSRCRPGSPSWTRTLSGTTSRMNSQSDCQASHTGARRRGGAEGLVNRDGARPCRTGVSHAARCPGQVLSRPRRRGCWFGAESESD